MRVGSRLSGMSDCLSAHRSQHGAVSLPFGFTLPGSSGDDSADLHLPIHAITGRKRLLLMSGFDTRLTAY